MDFENLQKNMAMINYKFWYYKQALEDGNEEQLENKIPEEIKKNMNWHIKDCSLI